MTFYQMLEHVSKVGPHKIEDLKAFRLIATLIGDAQKSLNALGEDDGDYTKRQYVRTLFTLIEGTVFELKTYLLTKFEDRLSAQEVSLLAEKTYGLNGKGEPTSFTSHLFLPSNLIFAFSTFARVAGAELDIDKSSADWSAFQTAIKVRNRLTHPKDIGDLGISAGELDQVRKTHNWVTGLYFTVSVMMITHLSMPVTDAEVDYKTAYDKQLIQNLQEFARFMQDFRKMGN